MPGLGRAVAVAQACGATATFAVAVAQKLAGEASDLLEPFHTGVRLSACLLACLSVPVWCRDARLRAGRLQ